MRWIITAAVCAALAAPAWGQAFSVAAADTTHSVLAAQKGKRVIVRLRSGQELTGLVRDATDKLLVLGEVAGREFFDAVVPLEAVEAVFVRVKP